MSRGWSGRPSPKSMQMKNAGWLSEVNRVYTDTDKKYAVMIRTVETEWGTVQHAAIRNAENTDISWAEKQRIKNELFGTERTAIEVFPAETELIDAANMYHLWILPTGMKLPITLRDRGSRVK